ncbi:MAG TPA: response regulator transcription factor [Chitinophagales bacterium]|nr:response regulator transcription factor [Chitinophagales bacterium]
MEEIRVVIFDDNPRVRDAIQMLVAGTEGFLFVAAFENCNDLVSCVEASTPDVALMDIDMPGVSGIEAVKIIRSNFPSVQVLMQTVFDDDEKIFNAVCAGAGGYILKNTPPAKILESIQEVFHGGAPMSPSIARKVLQLFSENVSQKEIIKDYNLSAREKEVLALLVQGKSYKMISDDLSITYDTVRAHMKKIYEKLHVSSMTEAVAKAIHHRLT